MTSDDALRIASNWITLAEQYEERRDSYTASILRDCAQQLAQAARKP